MGSHSIYLLAALILLAVWGVLFLTRRDMRRCMIIMSLCLGLLSVVTAYYWWTIDWWRPETITGTRVGIEDFISGFASGGIMAVAYEVLFGKQLYRLRIKCIGCPDYMTLLLLLAFLTSWLFWGVGITSFWASSVAMLVVAAVLFYFRKDLLVAGITSGVLMAAVSSLSYALIILLSPGWISSTYQFNTLSGILILGVPIEEFVFWFLAGLVFGPFYEYWQGDGLRRLPARRR